jgi:5-methylcytosine-specific restriction enzyme subunit McrC
VQQKLREVVLLLHDVKDIHDARETLKEIIYTRSNDRFRSLMSFCTLILGGNNPSVSIGDTETFSLLFPMEKVFESFVGAVIRKNLSQWGFPEHKLHLQYKSRRGHLLHFIIHGDAPKPRIQVRPDIAIEDKGGNPVLVIDTKWKRLTEKEDRTRSSASMSDIYQVYSYAHHFSCSTNIILYPSAGDTIQHRYQLAASPDKLLLINQLDLGIDLLTDASLFAGQVRSIIETALAK